jgi:hypothetical protein
MAGVDKNICDKINLKCFSRYLPVKCLKHIINEFDLNLEIKVYTKDTKSNDVLIKPKSKDGIIKLSLYRHHYFVHEETPFNDTDFNVKLRFKTDEPYKPLQLTSTRLLMLLFELNLMRPMMVKELPPDITDKNISDLSISNYALRLPGVENSVNFQDALNDDKLIPRFAWSLFEKQLKGCYGISGVIKYFVQQAAHGARVFATPGIFKNITLLDINSLYPSVMATMEIPTGAPQVWNDKMDLSKCNYYILGIDITETRPCELYPYAKTGYKVMDKYDIEDQVKETGMKFNIVRGYVWNSGSQIGRAHV